MSLNILCLLSDFDLECLHCSFSEYKKDSFFKMMSPVHFNLLNFTIGNFLDHCFFFTEINSCYINVTLFISKVKQFIIFFCFILIISFIRSSIPSNRSEQALVWILVVEKHFLAFAISVDTLIVSNSEHETISLHYIEYLYDSMILFMNSFFLFSVKNKLTILSPITSCFKIKH